MSIRRDKIQLEVEINGQKAGKTYGELTNDARNLQREIKLLTPGTDAFIKKSKELSTVNTKLSQIKKTTLAVKNEATGLPALFKKFLPALGAAAIIGGIIGIGRSILRIGKESLRFFDIQAKADAQLRAGLESTNGVVGRSFEDLKKQARDLQGITLFGDEQIQQAQSILLTFTKVRTEINERATPAILDMATKLDLDLKSASLQVGKALNDPILGVTALGRAGVQFTVEQKGMIKSLQETGQLAKAQTLILEELENQFSGSAEAAAKAGLGGFTQMGNRVSDVKEQIGELITRGLTRLAPALSNVLSFVEKFVDRMVTGKKATGDMSAGVNGLYNVMKFLVAAFNAVIGPIGKVIVSGLTFLKIIAAIPEFIRENKVAAGALGVALITLNSAAIATAASTLLMSARAKVATIATAAQTLAQRGLNTVLKANPMGLIITAISLLVAGFSTAYNKSEKFRATIKGLGNVASEVFNIIKEAVGNFVTGFQQIKNGDIFEGLKSIGKGIVDSNPLKIALTEGKRLKNAFNEGFINSLEKDADEKAAESLLASVSSLDEKFEAAGTELGKNIGDDIIDGINDQLNSGKSKILRPKIAPLESIETIASNGITLEDSNKLSQERIDARLESFKIAGDKELDLIQIQFLKRLLTEQEFEEESLRQKESNFQRQLDLLTINGLTETDVFRKTQIDQLTVQKQIDDKKLENTKRTRELQEELEDENRASTLKTLDTAIQALNTDEAIRKKHAAAIKAFEIAKIGVNLSAEIQGIWKNAQTFGPFATIKAIIETGFATARATLQSKKIANTKFFHGGPTGNNGIYKDNLGTVAGVVHTGEWVSPQWMVEHPTFGPVVNYLESVRQRKGGYMEGGLTTNVDTTPVGLAGVPITQDVRSNNDISAMMQKLDQVLTVFANFPSTIKAYVVPSELQAVANEISDIEKQASF